MPDYSNMPSGFYSSSTCSVRDLLDVQLNVPDRFLLEHLLGQPAVAWLDEHTLVRLLPFVDINAPVLREMGYSARFNYGELVELMRNKITALRLPTNEDQMYDRLFSPRTGRGRPNPLPRADRALSSPRKT